MESLPSELHGLILELACASYSGSHIPQVLSRTSSYFHAVAAPFLFHTISISSQDQAIPLLVLLEATPAYQRRIRRLFVGAALPPATVLRLLHFAAPTLYDLAVAAPSALLAAVFCTPMPHLKSLCVRGFYPLPRAGAFPALTHLHLAGNHSPAGLPAALARTCPALTHLRISSLRGAPAFARELRAALRTGGTFLPLIARVSLEAQVQVGEAKPGKFAQARDLQMRETLLALCTGEDVSTPYVQFLDVREGGGEDMKRAWLVLDCP